MPAPIPIAHTHVRSLRIASGVEALVARALATQGAIGYGFTLRLDAAAARDMAAWDALGRSRDLSLCDLLGGCRRTSVALQRESGDVALPRVDPFAAGSVERAQAMIARGDRALVLVAPNAHPWEISFCAALAAAYPGENVRIVLPAEPAVSSIAVPQTPGVGVDWSCEPAFADLRW